MTLLLTVFAAVSVTVLWYNRKDDTMHLEVLCFLFWGASLMWLADAIFEYAELGAEYFTPALKDMANDAFLGLSVIAFALVIWILVVLVKDSKGTVRAALKKKKR
jgi:hypothetical protein